MAADVLGDPIPETPPRPAEHQENKPGWLKRTVGKALKFTGLIALGVGAGAAAYYGKDFVLDKAKSLTTGLLPSPEGLANKAAAELGAQVAESPIGDALVAVDNVADTVNQGKTALTAGANVVGNRAGNIVGDVRTVVENAPQVAETTADFLTHQASDITGRAEGAVTGGVTGMFNKVQTNLTELATASTNRVATESAEIVAPVGQVIETGSNVVNAVEAGAGVVVDQGQDLLQDAQNTVQNAGQAIGADKLPIVGGLFGGN